MKRGKNLSLSTMLLSCWSIPRRDSDRDWCPYWPPLTYSSNSRTMLSFFIVSFFLDTQSEFRCLSFEKTCGILARFLPFVILSRAWFLFCGILRFGEIDCAWISRSAWFVGCVIFIRVKNLVHPFCRVPTRFRLVHSCVVVVHRQEEIRYAETERRARKLTRRGKLSLAHFCRSSSYTHRGHEVLLTWYGWFAVADNDDLPSFPPSSPSWRCFARHSRGRWFCAYVLWSLK
jgi:hypothetical protein